MEIAADLVIPLFHDDTGDFPKVVQLLPTLPHRDCSINPDHPIHLDAILGNDWERWVIVPLGGDNYTVSVVPHALDRRVDESVGPGQVPEALMCVLFLEGTTLCWKVSRQNSNLP